MQCRLTSCQADQRHLSLWSLSPLAKHAPGYTYPSWKLSSLAANLAEVGQLHRVAHQAQ
jgi:hypothetical protein